MLVSTSLLTVVLRHMGFLSLASQVETGSWALSPMNKSSVGLLLTKTYLIATCTSTLLDCPCAPPSHCFGRSLSLDHSTLRPHLYPLLLLLLAFIQCYRKILCCFLDEGNKGRKWAQLQNLLQKKGDIQLRQAVKLLYQAWGSVRVLWEGKRYQHNLQLHNAIASLVLTPGAACSWDLGIGSWAEAFKTCNGDMNL